MIGVQPAFAPVGGRVVGSRPVVIAANRLPVTVRLQNGRLTLRQASGGLATGLSGCSGPQTRWIGWPGNRQGIPPEHRQALDAQLRRRRLLPVYLSADQVSRYYEGFANRVLWPLFHYLIDRIPVDAKGWDAYRQVNDVFATRIVEAYRPGDLVWIHDYQLMLVPALVRRRLPHAAIGFFLHIPFPSSEVFRVLPWRAQIIEGLLGADLIGFHTSAYVTHFLAAVRHVQRIEAEGDTLVLRERRARAAVFPMSVDAAAFATLARDDGVAARVKAIRPSAGRRRIVLGVDRLDYTKGIPRRLQALERLLERAPELRDTLRYVQIAVPSRENVEPYQAFRRQVEEAVGRINGHAGTVRSTPIHYLHRSVSKKELVALFCAADIMLVTPLRDGMNLVAKEFVASRVDDDGVLVLSEFAGAALELTDAVMVNPYDVDGTAAAIGQALKMAPAERASRMRALRRRVIDYDVHRWGQEFLACLGAGHPPLVNP